MQTIIFDVDDTLYDQASSFKKTCKKIFQQPFTEEELDKLYLTSRKHSDALFDKSETGEVSQLQLQTQRITAACEEFKIPITYKEAVAFQQAYVEEQQKITLFPEVKQLLDLLYKENKQLGILTNGEENHQAMKIQQLNLTKWIPKQHIFISGSLGVAKPKREVFDIIEKKLSLDKNKTIYVGDSFDNDIVGAKQAGWHAIWMNHRKRDKPKNSVSPDKEIHNANELLEYFS